MSNELIVSNHAYRIAVALDSYPDTMPLVKAQLQCSGSYSMLLRPRSLASFVAALFFVDACRDRGLHAHRLVLPFVPGSRQDRLNPEGDQLFTLKSVAQMINARKFYEVVVLDPHSDVTPALIERCRVVHADRLVRNLAGQFDVVVSPDAGAEKRATRVAKLFGVPLLRAWKTRDIETGKITGFGIEPPSGGVGSALVVDDICDGGGTFLGLAKVLQDNELEASLWTTHGIYSQGTKELLKHYGKLYCTDSYDSNQNDGVTVINVCEGLL